jgi:hypothetical protein
MDAKRVINTRMWADSWFEELNSAERLIWLYLLTNQQTNLLGIYEISLRRISNETGVDIDVCETIMERFGNDSKAFYNDGYILIVNWIKNQQMNSNMIISAKKILEALPEKIKKWLLKLGISDFESLENGSVTIAQRWKEIEIEIEKEIENEIESENGNGSLPEPIAMAVSEVSFFKPDGNVTKQPATEQPDEKKKKVAPKKKNEIPELSEFLDYAKSWMERNGKDYEGKRVQIESKYQAWKDAGWKDGFNKPISNWKSKFQNTEPFIKSDGKNYHTTRKTAREPNTGSGFGKL